jgi:hypothetical protein
MARTGPVMRAGASARAWLGGVMVTAVAATAIVLLAGCGTRIANLPARAGATPAATASARPGTGAGPAAGSRAGAQELATRLLSRLVLPPGARPVRLQELPPLLRQPPIGYGEVTTTYVHRVFVLRQPTTAVQAFLKGHLPAGMRLLSSSQPTHSGGIGMESVSFNPRSLPAGIHSAELNTEVVPAAGGGSLMRADAAATWYPARSAGEHIDPTDYRAAVVSVTMLNPRRHTVTGTFANSRVIAGLAGLANGLHAAPDVPMGCPAVLASYRIVFVPASGRAPRIAVAPSGCLTVAATAAGAPQPALWGDAGLIRAAKRLLHVTSVR